MNRSPMLAAQNGMLVVDYKVQLDVYSGPLDLLLFLIRRNEIDIYNIPVAKVTEQYLEYVSLLQQLDPEAVSEFLVLAATLLEIKSRMLLPKPPPEESDSITLDPRAELVRQLLEYKDIKDAARALEHAAEERAKRWARAPVLPEREENEIELDHVDIWDLFEAFNRLLEQTGKTGPFHQVGVDDTPMALHAADILDALDRAGGAQAFEEIFRGRTRAEMIGLFLALLELIRQRKVRAVQDRPLGPIQLRRLTEEEAATLGAAEADRPEYHEYDRAPLPATEDESMLEEDTDDLFEELARIRETPLEDLGIDADFLNEKHNRTEPANGMVHTLLQAEETHDETE